MMTPVGNAVSSQGGVDAFMHGLVGFARPVLAFSIVELCLPGSFKINIPIAGGITLQQDLTGGFGTDNDLVGGFSTETDIEGMVPDCD